MIQQIFVTIEIGIVVGTDVLIIVLVTGGHKIGVVAVEVDSIVIVIIDGMVAVVETGSTIIEEIIDMTTEDIVEVIAAIEILDMTEIAVTTEEEMKIAVIIGIFGMATATGVSQKINVVTIAGCHKEKRMKNI